MNSFKNVLVFGATGLTGRGLQAIAPSLPGREFRFLGSRDCDLTNREAVLECVRRHAPDAIMNLAAVSGGIGFSKSRPATMLRDNVLMNLHLLEAARLLRIPKSLHMLSVGMYPPSAALPLRETSLHDGPAHESNYSYAYAKRLIEPAITAYRTEYGLNVVGVVPNGIFGENMNFKRDESIMLAALIRRFHENRNGTGPLEVWGDGTALREYTYSQDMARACLWCLDHYEGEGILNIGSNEEHSVASIATMVAESLGIDPSRIHFDRSKPGGIHRRPTDNLKFVTCSGFRYTPFREGLSRTVRWFEENLAIPGAVRL